MVIYKLKVTHVGDGTYACEHEEDVRNHGDKMVLLTEWQDREKDRVLLCRQCFVAWLLGVELEY